MRHVLTLDVALFGLVATPCHGVSAQAPDASPVVTPGATLTAAAGTDVPMFRGNAARTGVMPGPGPAGQPVELWRYQIPGKILSQPAVVGRVLYVGGGDGGVYALDAANGEEIWHVAVDTPISSSPAVVNGLVYTGSDDGILHALDAGTGEERWAFPGTRQDASAAVADGVVYTGSEDGFPYALDAMPSTRRRAWRCGARSLGQVRRVHRESPRASWPSATPTASSMRSRWRAGRNAGSSRSRAAASRARSPSRRTRCTSGARRGRPMPPMRSMP